VNSATRTRVSSSIYRSRRRRWSGSVGFNFQCIENPALGESARQNTPQERSAAQFARHQSSISKSGGEMIGNLSRHSGVERQSGPQCLPRKRAAMARRWRFIAAPYSLIAVASRRIAVASKRTAAVRRFRASLTCFSRSSVDFGETTPHPSVLPCRDTYSPKQ
jgi:hypothetical protein